MEVHDGDNQNFVFANLIDNAIRESIDQMSA